MKGKRNYYSRWDSSMLVFYLDVEFNMEEQELYVSEYLPI